MATVYEDKRGPYVKAGGWLFRPVFPVGYKHVFSDGTSFKAGDKVPARHRGGSSLGTVGTGAKKETWYAHGFYFGTGKLSEELWMPNDGFSW